ncbi:ZP domain-containing protein-like [Anneissia japonica]|uniref:ZP domain-containing protein-like n=1 Tax=Anneissia japonica TaxID=1529436 RepID=UPI0014255B36|nr:ZP domain-containing protein-like [Anneissia japonica]
MTVYLDSSINNVDTVRFLDSTCTTAGYVYRNGSRWVYMYTRYDQCQTSMTSTPTSTTYHNQIIVSAHRNSLIHRKDDIRISVECELANKGRSSVSFDPMGTSEDFTKREHGNFTFTMALYTDANYSTTYPDWQYPVEMNLGSNVFVGVSVKTFTNDMALYVDSCKATSNPDPDVHPQYKLIENSCGVDSTIQFDGQSTSNETSYVFFSFETFGFDDFSTVFIHCQLSICNESDWRCHRDCYQRRRRDIADPDKLSDTIPIVLGPVILKRSEKDSNVILDTQDSHAKDTSLTISSTPLFVVSLVVLVVGCAFWIKSRATNRKRLMYQQLETNIDEM